MAQVCQGHSHEPAWFSLLGRPAIDGTPSGYQMRSRKSWALLTYLLLSERPPTRTQLAALLFEQADDPLRGAPLGPGGDPASAGRRGVDRG